MIDTIFLEAEDGSKLELEQLWNTDPILLFFMRQLGCGLCRQQLLKLKEQASAFDQIGAKIAVIIMGDSKMASGLRDLYRLPFPVYADPAMQAYGAFDIGETSLWNVLGPHVIARQVGTIFNGIRPLWGAGSIKQLGGLVALNTQGQIIYHHIASPIYRYPPWEEVLKALQANQPFAEPV